MKVRAEINNDSDISGYSFYCPACEYRHIFFTIPGCRPSWDFNGDVNNPSFRPSLLNTATIGPQMIQTRCHLYVTDGKINYCDDCTHNYAGRQGVEMVPQTP